MADLFDRAPAPAKAAKRFDATTPCPLCQGRVEGIDPMRTCDACRAAGAPARVPWEQAKPADAALCGAIVIPSESSITVGPHPAQLKLGEAA